MAWSLPPVCSGVPVPSQRGSSAAQPSLHDASPEAKGAKWSALPCQAQSLQKHPAPSQERRTHNSLLEGNQLLFLFLSSFKVAVDEGLELHEVLVLTLFLDVLGDKRKVPTLPGQPGTYLQLRKLSTKSLQL